GEYRDAKTDRSLDIVDPSTGEAYVQAPISSAADIDDACRAAARAFESWKRTTPSERSLAILRLADGLEANADEFIAEEVRNTGKPMRYMRDEEFPMLVDHLRYMATLARNLTGLASGSYAPGYDSAVRREPVGVCGQVAPWNYPLMMGVWKFGPALAAGNTVVLKPSDTTPVTTALLGKIAGEHLPPGVLNIVVGDRDTGRALVDHPIPSLISVTGSTRAGHEVSLAAAADLKRVHLELGGKAPVVVFGDVDVAEAAAGVASAGLVNSGQDCAAGCRILVHEDIYNDFVEALVAEYSAKRYGPPKEDPDIGPMNSAAHLAKIAGFFDRLPGHAQVRIGGSADPVDGGFYFRPTLVAGLQQRDEMIQEEVFGPVQTVQPFRDEAQALEMANDVRYGLAASVWTKDYETALRVSGDLDFGQVWINCHLIQPAELPNGGYKHSGHGNDLSMLALDDYTRVKQVTSALPRR
ncbi:MAG TPA: aldehyde dehydrogenase family protein, partial [Ilumatobacteraceae bacterium]|nr:aldehyde dehydrogenase family protein [Ilumatobacteraceae bacterium]